MSDEPRWTVRVDGPSVHLTLRARTSIAAWLPHAAVVLALLPCGTSAFAVLVWGLVAETRDGATRLGEVAGLGVLAVLAGVVASTTAWFAVRALAWIAWSVGGHERVAVHPDRVDIERDGFGIRARVAVPRAPRPSGSRPPLVPRIRWGLPRPGERGGLRVTVPGGVDIRVGLDLTRAEAEAVAAEIDLIREAQRPRAA